MSHELELARPSPQHVETLARVMFMTLGHPPFESVEEMCGQLAGGNRHTLDQYLLLLYANRVVGCARVGPMGNGLSLFNFGLVPPFSRPQQAAPLVGHLVRELRGTLSDLRHSIYEEPYRQAFEAAGVQTINEMKVVVAPIVRREVAPLPMRHPVAEDAPLLAELLAAAYGTDLETFREAAAGLGTAMSQASYVGLHSDGTPGFPAASLIQGREGQKRPRLAHAVTHPDHQKKGWGTALVQASINHLTNLGCVELDGLAELTNEGVFPLHRRVGLERRGPLIYEGILPD